MDLNKLFSSLYLKILIGIMAILVIFLIGLKLGTMVGFRRADFSCGWGENYHRNFGGPADGLFGKMMPRHGFDDRAMLDGNSAFGKIIKKNGNELIIKGQDELEKKVIIDHSTIIERFRDRITSNDLQENDNVLILGEPNDSGQIVAKLIRLLPIPRETSFLRAYQI